MFLAEMKDQENFSDHFFVGRPSLSVPLCKLFTFLTSSEPLGKLLTNLTQSIPRYRGLKSVLKKGHFLFQGE